MTSYVELLEDNAVEFYDLITLHASHIVRRTFLAYCATANLNPSTIMRRIDLTARAQLGISGDLTVVVGPPRAAKWGLILYSRKRTHDSHQYTGDLPSQSRPRTQKSVLLLRGREARNSKLRADVDFYGRCYLSGPD